MRIRRNQDAAMALGMALLLTLGCGGDDIAGPPTGSIEITLGMNGSSPDADGCRVAVDDGAGQVLLDAESVTAGGLSAGVHTVSISGVAFNCTVQGQDSRSVTVIANEIATVDFQLDCPAPGRIELISRTAGSLIDPDGYTVTLGGGADSHIGVSDTVALEQLAVGEHDVGLTGLADNCAVIGENPRAATVEEGETTRLDISVVCPPFDDHIAFTSYRDPNLDGTLDLWVMNSDGSNPVKLTDHPKPDSDPAWSPDGTRIAFRSSRDGKSNIWVMDADGSDAIDLTAQIGRYASTPAWSPDGTRMAFTSYWGADSEIYVIGTDGSNPVNLTNHEAEDRWPTWSPDGTRIAFVSRRDGNAEIYVMNADGSNPANLTNHPDGDTEPAWSPDGTWIVFESGRDDRAEIYVMNADGSNQRNVSSDPATDRNPSWSPDGSRIVFESRRDCNTEIYVMSADGSNPERLTRHAASDRDPAWSPLGDDAGLRAAASPSGRIVPSCEDE